MLDSVVEVDMDIGGGRCTTWTTLPSTSAMIQAHVRVNAHKVYPHLHHQLTALKLYQGETLKEGKKLAINQSKYSFSNSSKRGKKYMYIQNNNRPKTKAVRTSIQNGKGRSYCLP